MKNLNFIEHTTNAFPKDLLEDTLVVYRTTSSSTPVSHIHFPIAAGLLNWSEEDQYMGSILEYKVYENKAKVAPNLKDCDEYIDHIPLLGSHA